MSPEHEEPLELHQLPAPLVAAHVDLRGYQFMPLLGDVLFRSSFHTRATDAEFRAAVRLWWSSWWEIPASSLPNNERDLCRLAGLDSLRRWRKMRDSVMRKWVLCSDDRWYHPILADLSTEAFSKRINAATKGRNGANKRWEIKRHAHSTGNSAGNATANDFDSPGNAPANKSDSTGNSNRSKGLSINIPKVETSRPVHNSAEPRSGNSTSTPQHASHSLAKAAQHIEEQRTWQASPMPEHLRPRTPHEDPPNPGENHDDETLDS